MAWKIHSWSAETGVGEVVSSHFGPWRFGPDENREGTTDFAVGDAVVVELSGTKDNYIVSAVARKHDPAREAPAGSECDAFEALNAATLADVWIKKQSDSELTLWVGDCCRQCSDTFEIEFCGVSASKGLDEDNVPDEPFFRYATAHEVEEHGLVVPAGSRAYRIVATCYGDAVRGEQDAFVVAEGVSLELLPILR